MNCTCNIISSTPCPIEGHTELCKDFLDILSRITLNTLRAEHKRELEEIIIMANKLEVECGKDGDKGTKQWMAFKGFRNAIRDKFITPYPLPEDKKD